MSNVLVAGAAGAGAASKTGFEASAEEACDRVNSGVERVAAGAAGAAVCLEHPDTMRLATLPKVEGAFLTTLFIVFCVTTARLRENSDREQDGAGERVEANARTTGGRTRASLWATNRITSRFLFFLDSQYRYLYGPIETQSLILGNERGNDDVETVNGERLVHC